MGGLLLALQPVVILVELVVATRWDLPYDLTRNTISDLGAATCTTISASYGQVPVCSPWHGLMNATFLAVGLALALGPLLARRALPLLPVVLLVVAGISSAAVGLAPLDTHSGLHGLVATPLFIAQPVALLLLAVAARRHRRSAAALLLAGLVATGGALAFAVTLVTGDVGGLYERVALWPCHLGLAVLGVSLVRGGVWETPGVSAAGATGEQAR
ncbi:hypothetical protein BH11ACT8_BH11ACT8_12440 [soil metagenome]